MTVHGDGGREHEAANLVVDRGVDQVDAAEQVVLVVEPFDEVAQAFGGERREVEDVREAVLVEQTTHELDVQDRSLDERRARADVAAQAARQIVERDDLVAAREERIDDVRADEPRGSGHQNLAAGSRQAASGYMKVGSSRRRMMLAAPGHHR